MRSHEISFERLQQIIKEEVTALTEAVDHKSISDVVGVASKLLSAVENFKAKAPAAAINALTPHLGEIEKMLENMLSSPGSYVPVVKKEPKRVSLKAVKGEGTVRESGQGQGFEPPGSWGRGKQADVDLAVTSPVDVASDACPCCGSERVESLTADVEAPSAAPLDVGLVCLECKKTTWTKGAKRIDEATGGDGRFERVDETNWQHLEVGNTYLVRVGRERVKCTFVGWVDKQGKPTEGEDPNEVDLRFADVDDGMEWEAYWSDRGGRAGCYSVGSSSDVLFVKETD